MAYRESETLELKKTTGELKEAVISIAAILNKHRRGRVYFGIRNDGEVVGQVASGRTVRDVSRAISEGIEPRIYPVVTRVSLRGKPCIRVGFSGSDAPYLAYGRAYLRVGEEDRQVSARQLGRMFAQRAGGASRWESELSSRRLSEVNARVLREFVKRARSAGRIGAGAAGARVVLGKLGLVAGGRLLRAGEVLFCDANPLQVQAAVFAGTDKRTFLDIKHFTGTLFEVLQRCATYVQEHINWRVTFGRVEREEVPEIPQGAVREALVNSLSHRDYAVPRGNELAIFKDRIEIYNPGSFPEGLTPQDFIRGAERSVLRNPLIADALYCSRDIERWGSGLKRISDECREAGVKVRFRLLKTGFLVTFHRTGVTPPVTPRITPPITSPVALTGLESRLLDLIARDPSVSRTAMAARLGITLDTVKEYVRRLKDKSLLRRHGRTRAGHWEVAKR